MDPQTQLVGFQVKEKLSLISEAIGKTLLWTYQDPETELFYLLFEGGVLLSSDSVNLIPDSEALTKRILGESLDDAKRILVLKDLVEKLYVKPAEPVPAAEPVISAPAASQPAPGP
jgi:hypothetical protein